MCGRCNSTYYGETDRDLKVGSGERIEIAICHLTFKKPERSKESAIRDHILNCNYIRLLRSLPS